MLLSWWPAISTEDEGICRRQANLPYCASSILLARSYSWQVLISIFRVDCPAQGPLQDMHSVPRHKETLISEGFCLVHSPASVAVPRAVFCIASLLKMIVYLGECNGDVRPALCLPNLTAGFSKCISYLLIQWCYITHYTQTQWFLSVIHICYHTHRCREGWVVFLRLQCCEGWCG